MMENITSLPIKNGTTAASGSGNDVIPEWLAFLTIFAAVVFYTLVLLPVKKYDAGDGNLFCYHNSKSSSINYRFVFHKLHICLVIFAKCSLNINDINVLFIIIGLRELVTNDFELKPPFFGREGMFLLLHFLYIDQEIVLLSFIWFFVCIL